MKLAPVTYHSPTSIAEATALLAEHSDDAKVIAGGQSLIPMLSYRLASPAHLIDIARIDELAGFSLDGDELRIRARATQREVERSPDIGLAFPVLHEAISNIAHVQIRNRGTVCGSLAHADAAAELPATMVALSASMVVQSVDGRREIPAEEFFQFHLTSALEPHELLVEVRIPRMSKGTVATFLEVTHRRGDFALVGTAVLATFRDSGHVEDARIVCSGVGSTPVRVRAAEDVIRATRLDDDVLLDAQRATSGAIAATSDIHATAAYREQVAGVVVRRCLHKIRAQRGDSRG
ncbi:MAG TPA: xanthine dehydrogenase family protein subunit M [Nocardioidaceae bacterium]|nr:xanthine dehydrogenase family protein subunit M [Nocardioidaceae bacterium]